MLVIFCIGCSRKKEEGLYANIGLLYLCFEAARLKIRLTNLKEVEEYANRVKNSEDYYGYISWAMIYLKCKRDKTSLGVDVLNELISEYPSRPEAYIVLWNHIFK